MVIATLFPTAFAVGVGLGYLRWKSPPISNKIYRLLVIDEQAEQMPAGGTLVIGDSLVERQRISSLCGEALNAGIGSATTADFTPHVGRIAAKARPARVVVNLGVNDIARGVAPAEVERRVGMILSALPLTSQIVLVGIPGLAKDPLEGLAQRQGVHYLPYPVPRELTHDGLHMTAEGARVWQRSVGNVLCPDLTMSYPHQVTAS